MKATARKKASAPTEASDRKVVYLHKEFNTMAPKIEAKDIPEYPYSPEPVMRDPVRHKRPAVNRKPCKRTGGALKGGKLLVSACLGISTFLNAYILTLGVSARLDGYPLPYWLMIMSLMLFSALVGFGAYSVVTDDEH